MRLYRSLVKFWYSTRNLWYWKPRHITQQECVYLSKLSSDNPALAATELLLLSVGLRVVDEQGQLDGIHLTTVQREAVAAAAERGYHAGL